ncbi:MAG: L-2-amino-thiazoline-4-carboxylic acid hydrolase [Deltaproteobacteria bacterium]|nr:L-2-amino-thiazoline-4-carboxylic acid hydrolase [Deltaproteobacteria bacterium]
MSTFLGPIHHWLFNKIKIVEDREKALLDAFAKRYGDKPERLNKELQKKYAPWFDDTPLDNLIGDHPIHAWLSAAIEKVETREAAFMKALIDNYGKEAEGLSLEVSYLHGRKNGKKATEEYLSEDPTPEDIYKILKNFFLDGMQCDHIVEVDQHSDRVIVEKHTDCLHRTYWRNAGMPEGFMCDYILKWMDGFVAAFSGRIRHLRQKSISKGDTHCEDVFKKE